MHKLRIGYGVYIVVLAVGLVLWGGLSAHRAKLAPAQSGQWAADGQPAAGAGKAAAHKFTEAQFQPPSELPLGGRSLFPDYRLVALYGHPDMPALGALGDQSLAASIKRAKKLAAGYQPHTKAKVMPTLEIIATVASSTPTDNKDYSNETEPAALLPWIKAAQEAGVYVVLDLQSGRSDFLAQAKAYKELLQYPNVGLALDPEWRLKSNQKPLVQIGSVRAAEVNKTAVWLAELTARHKLPQKLFLLHQFRLDMITGRDTLDVSHPELAYAIQMDGHGSQQQKQDTWRAIMHGASKQMHFGWKNFYKVDSPMLSPAKTMQVAPQPWYVSYQ